MKITKDILDQLASQKRKSQLLDSVQNDIIDFLNNRNRFFFNERELNMNLAMYLMQQSKYDDVEVEYRIPRDFNPTISKAYITLSYDIMVSKDGEFVPIEIIYKLNATNYNLKRCGEDSAGSTQITSNQCVRRDLVCYSFWNDVKRVEILRDSFKSVNGGFVLFLTDDSDYINLLKKSVVIISDCTELSLGELHKMDWHHFVDIYDVTKGINVSGLHGGLMRID